MSIGDAYIEVGYTDHTVKVFDYEKLFKFIYN